MSRLIVVACDPGGRDCGLVVRLEDIVVDFVVRESVAAPHEPPPPSYGWAVCDWMAEQRDHALSLGYRVLMAVEGLNVPTGYRKGAKLGEKSTVRPAAVMGVSMVYGAVTATFRDVVVVAPGGHGEGPLRSYPAELVGLREKGVYGKGILRHARSAWDVAAAGRRQARYPLLTP